MKFLLIAFLITASGNVDSYILDTLSLEDCRTTMQIGVSSAQLDGAEVDLTDALISCVPEDVD